MLKNYNLFIKNNKNINESAPSIPNSEDYWKKKGKEGKKVMLYFHDDLDGIYSAIAMKGYLEDKGFEIEGYGIVNYQEGWTSTKLDNKYINIALDYAENVKGIDVYMDHHGEFKEGENDDIAAVKTATSSAYEGIMDQLGLPIDSTIQNVIDMVDSAKYDDYDVDIKNILVFDPKKFKNKLEFAAAFNQLLKRSDHKTFIEVVANTKGHNPSIYNIYRLFRILYPANNLNNAELKKIAKNVIDDRTGEPKYAHVRTDEDGNEVLNRWGKPYIDVDLKGFIEDMKKDATGKRMLRDFEKDFLDDADWRLGQMEVRTRGLNAPQKGVKDYIDSQAKFKELFAKKGKGGNDKVQMPGYQIIGNMCFVPSGTWANALRARAILEQDLLNDERIPIIEYHVTEDSKHYSELKKSDGKKFELVGDLGKYEKHQTINVKQDVTNDPNVEGIPGEIKVDGDDVRFIAKQPIFWILLQYGNTMQVASLHKFDLYVKEYLPKLKDGSTVEDLGEYCNQLMDNMAKYFGYNVLALPESTTKSGGHKGIGSVSNIFGSVEANAGLISVPDPRDPDKQLKLADNAQAMMKKFNGVKFLDLIKNKMIDDLSGVDFKDLKMQWGDPEEKPAPKPKDEDMNKKVMMKDKIRKAQDVQKQYKEWDEEDILSSQQIANEISGELEQYLSDYESGKFTAKQLINKMEIEDELKSVLKKMDEDKLKNLIATAISYI